MKQVQDVVERLWIFIERLDINTLGTFLADNMVGSVVAFSLLLWVPLSVLVHCVVSGRSLQGVGGVLGAGLHSPRPHDLCVRARPSGQEAGPPV